MTDCQVEGPHSNVAQTQGPKNGSDAIHLVEHLELDNGAIVFNHARALGYEGTVSKRPGSPHTSGRTRDWIKTKNPESIGNGSAKPARVELSRNRDRCYIRKEGQLLAKSRAIT